MNMFWISHAANGLQEEFRFPWSCGLIDTY